MAWRIADHLSCWPSKDKVHLKLEFNWDIKPLYNVIAKLPGNELPDEWVIGGNHHDGWVKWCRRSDKWNGSANGRGKSIGELVKKGFRPKRTLIFCAWDGEEPALLGSTEWVEDHQQELKQKAVAYINTDAMIVALLMWKVRIHWNHSLMK
jgi:N-acetylated-alpha-linked acidic dipeptidase